MHLDATMSRTNRSEVHNDKKQEGNFGSRIYSTHCTLPRKQTFEMQKLNAGCVDILDT